MDLEQRKWLSNFKLPCVKLAALACKNLINKSLKLSNLDVTEEEYEKATKTVKN